ncbi:MAG: sigma-70 family RNA polymerase sigma factor [Tissierellales bacterium]|jgi:toxin-associated regulator BotR|nr:sigma-70 family RNA polymerase sigma factor [Tissierellales bacterium]
MNLYKSLKDAQAGNSDAVLAIVKKFELSVKKFARTLKYPEAETDLMIEFLNLIQNLDLQRFNLDDEGQLVMYIYNSLNHKKIDLYRKHIQNKQELVFVADVYPISDNNYSNSFESDIIFNDIISSLKPIQKDIISMKYRYGYTDADISRKLGISRQAVYKSRNKALGVLRRNLV